jgi:hypothetical protein
MVKAMVYLLVITAAVVTPARRKYAMQGKPKKRAPFVISARKDERAVESAWNQNAVVLGYDMDEKPWLDDVRVMQGIVLGMTGSGKTTLLKNIICAGCRSSRWPTGGPASHPDGHFDGKGDLEFFEQLLPHIHRAGWLHQLRLLNPSRSGIFMPVQPVLHSRGQLHGAGERDLRNVQPA